VCCADRYRSPVSQQPRPGPHNDLTDVAGIRVGQYERSDGGWLTGTTVVLPPEGTVGGVDVRGGGPSTRETDALAPTTLVDAVHAVVLSGGSSYGLAAAGGVMDLLGAAGVGLPVTAVAGEVVPIVAAACLFDLASGFRFANRPDATFGRRAAEAASGRAVLQGNHGAGTGAHAGRLKGGVGSASVVLGDGTTVAALVAVNSSGSAVDARTGLPHGAGLLIPGELPELQAPPSGEVTAAAALLGTGGSPANTMLAVVATDASLAAPDCTRLAMAAHDGFARAVSPAHGMVDGDVVFALATGARPAADAGPAPGLLRIGRAQVRHLQDLMAAAADTVSRSVVHAVVAAESAGGLRSYRELFPGALRR
jgi:L-aminopeptidase/D-esterase-like protein